MRDKWPNLASMVQKVTHDDHLSVGEQRATYNNIC